VSTERKIGGYPVERLTDTPRQEPIRPPSDVNWGNTVDTINDQTDVTVLEFRWPGEPRTWALTLTCLPVSAALQFTVTVGSGGARRVVGPLASGNYLTHGQFIEVRGRAVFGRRLGAMISHGSGTPTI